MFMDHNMTLHHHWEIHQNPVSLISFVVLVRFPGLLSKSDVLWIYNSNYMRFSNLKRKLSLQISVFDLKKQENMGHIVTDLPCKWVCLCPHCRGRKLALLLLSWSNSVDAHCAWRANLGWVGCKIAVQLSTFPLCFGNLGRALNMFSFIPPRKTTSVQLDT